jgi:hypothetical protein
MFGIHCTKHLPVPDITSEELWITGRDIAEDPQFGPVRSAIETAMNDGNLTDVARGLLTVGASIRRCWHHNVGDFKPIRELTASLHLPLDADRNRLIGALFSRSVHRRMLSVNVVTADGKATCYEVGPFMRWLRKMCALLDVLSTIRTGADNTPLNEAMADLVLRNRV